MSLQRICKQDVVTVSPQATLVEVAQTMRARHVGCVIVVNEHRPVGILTDRDIVVRVVALGRDPKGLCAADVMATNPALVNANYDPLDATRIMRDRGLRRLPVVDENRRLVGIVTMDDVLSLLGKEISNLAEAVQTEIAHEGVGAARTA